tara:strand:- start:34555 stop:35223 length:669 start_codon:yes stop_codon:yes gene_type:complete
MFLEAKGLDYQINEISPVTGQLAIFKLSGQRKLPVLVDGDIVLSESNRICRYIEDKFEKPNLLPKSPKELIQSLIIEEWADTTLASRCKKVLIKELTLNSKLREILSPKQIPKSLNILIEKVPTNIINNISEVINHNELINLQRSLEHLSNFFQYNDWIIGNKLSIADIAICSQISILKFPQSSGEKLSNQGCHGFYDDPNLESLFAWRDRIESLIEKKKIN